MDSDTISLFPVSLLITILALAAVLALAWFALKGLSRFSTRQLGNSRVRIVQSVSVGNRERLVVVHFGNREYLVGVSAGGISTIDQQDIPDEAAALYEPRSNPRA